MALNNMMQKFLLFLFPIIMWTACSTDIALNAPYKPITIVVGLLDQGLDTQFVKINKTYLGEGNNLYYATVRDSLEYGPDAFNGKITEVINGRATREWEIQSKEMNNKSLDGIFYAPDYTAYYFVPEGGLKDEANYRLDLDFKDKEDVSASTNLIKNSTGNITYPPTLNPPLKLGFASRFGTFTRYLDVRFRWSSTQEARRYEVSMRIHYKEKIWADLEHTQLESEQLLFTDWIMGTQKTNDTEGGMEMAKEVNGEQFYTHLAARLESSPYITREIGYINNNTGNWEVMDFILTIANDELNTYMEINEPVTGVIQERPEYTNVNNGLGIFAARLQQGVYGLGLNPGSMKELVEGVHTADLNFCSPDALDPFYCAP